MTTTAQYRAALAAKMPEADLQERVIALARMLGWLEYHTHDSRRSRAGFPDLVLAHPTHGVLVRELKREGAQPTNEQVRWIGLLTAAGLNVGVWRPVDLLEGRVERALHGEAVVGRVG